MKGHRVERVSEESGRIVAEMVANRRSRPICSSCGRKMPGYDALERRTWRHVQIWGIAVTLAYRPRRGRCKKCGIKVEAMPWSAGKSPLSLPLIIVLATYARILAWEEVARLCGVSWNTVRAAVKSAVDHGLGRRDAASVIAIGIDEISRRKGHKYMTMVYDLSGMRLLWCGEGRDKAALRAFLEEWGEERRGQVKAVCVDMWQPYIEVIEEMLPGAVMVFDKSHIIRHLMDAVDKVRREEARKLKEEGQAELLSGTRYIFLKNAEKYLGRWLWWATHSRIEPMRDFARMIKRHKERILNYFRVPITHASVEGMNRKAKVVSQRAYGYRTVGTFQLALYHVLGDLPMPETTHRFL